MTDLLDLLRADERAEHAARFAGPTLPLPWACALGEEGEPVPTWKCPDCNGTELTAFALRINHGYDPEQPNLRAPHGGCWQARKPT